MTRKYQANGKVCIVCDQLILDRIQLITSDGFYHEKCLKCCVCGNSLQFASTCYNRNGNIYCKQDYFRLFYIEEVQNQSKTNEFDFSSENRSFQSLNKQNASSRWHCAACFRLISADELVMKISHLLTFHLHCFHCAKCGAVLRKGQRIRLIDAKLNCAHRCAVLATDPQTSLYPADLCLTDHGSLVKQEQNCAKSNGSNDGTSDDGEIERDCTSAYSEKHADLIRSNLSNRSRTKRNRTSFKYAQVKQMKLYFNANQNPDSKELRQLSAYTGLSKRVLQVWFQNARAKWRRNFLRQRCDGPMTAADPQPLESVRSSGVPGPADRPRGECRQTVRQPGFTGQADSADRQADSADRQAEPRADQPRADQPAQQPAQQPADSSSPDGGCSTACYSIVREDQQAWLIAQLCLGVATVSSSDARSDVDPLIQSLATV